MFIALVPVATVISTWTPGVLAVMTGLGDTVVLAEGSFWLCQLARNVDKSRERSLRRNWGGSPTAQFLRQRDRDYNQLQRRGRHRTLTRLGESDPTPDQEQHNPRVADAK